MIVGEAAELLGREVAAGDLDLDGGEALLALRLDVGGAEALERRRGRRWASRRSPGRAGALASSSWTKSAALDVEVALVDPVALELLLDLLAQLVDADLVDEAP